MVNNNNGNGKSGAAGIILPTHRKERDEWGTRQLTFPNHRATIETK